MVKISHLTTVILRNLLKLAIVSMQTLRAEIGQQSQKHLKWVLLLRTN